MQKEKQLESSPSEMSSLDVLLGLLGLRSVEGLDPANPLKLDINVSVWLLRRVSAEVPELQNSNNQTWCL